MRPIKYRAWDKETKEMREITGLHFFESGKLSSISYDSTGGEVQDIDVKFFEVMQFTGLKDKNGKMIWEGDILEYDGETCKHCNKLLYDGHKPYVITWKDAEFSCDEINSENFMATCIWPTSMKIIGNIYENKDLLEEEEDV